MTNELVETREQQLEAALSKVCAVIRKVAMNHVLTVATSSQPLNEVDLLLGNTRERQDGFEDAIAMVSADYMAPLVAVHDEVSPLLVRATPDALR